MNAEVEQLVLDGFRRAAARVPAYATVLAEAGVQPDRIKTPDDFRTLPVLNKAGTFQRFGIAQLCIDGRLGQLGTVLTSSGHSGIFAFGLADADALQEAVTWVDDSLDRLFAVRSESTLLINCLPMGVKIPTQACTLAETSVRPDMAVGLVQAFWPHFSQIILVGEAAFIKHVLELGQRNRVNWRGHRVHVIVGEEPLAENARSYLEWMLGHDAQRPERGMVISSMGVAEVGLNLFFEAPPGAPLIGLRRVLHADASLRAAVIGSGDSVPSLFTYDPRRILVEFDPEGRLILTTLDPRLRVPLMRYATGDRGAVVHLPPQLRPALEAKGVQWEALESLPIVAIRGRGEHALAGDEPVYPEAVKEGIYFDRSLAELTTANFRLVSGPERVRIRIQLSPGVVPPPELERRFGDAISRYVRSRFEVACERYEIFGSGMTLDYERKFNYLGL